MQYDDEPELAGYEPLAKSPRRRRRQNVLRLVVILGVLGLIVPGFVTTWSVASATAQHACAVLVMRAAPHAQGASARFEVFGPGLIGWECYTEGVYGSNFHVASLGLIPSAPAPLDRFTNT